MAGLIAQSMEGEILDRSAARDTNVEVAAALIEAETGLRFTACAVSRRRAERELPSPRRNDWTAPLMRRREGKGESTPIAEPVLLSSPMPMGLA